MTKIIVTITPPTPNGDLHIGHLAGPFLSADVFTRVQRQQGHDCVLVSYSDDYQSYMTRKGLEVSRDPVELARENTAKIKSTLTASNIAVDHWMQPFGNKYFAEAAREVFDAAVATGRVTTRASDEPYCDRCKQWGYEAFGRGRCNYCGSDSDASQCEQCAYPPDAARMAQFSCKVCRTPFEWRPVERSYLNIAAGVPKLGALFKHRSIRRPMNIWAEEVLDKGPREWAMTRPEEAGLDLAEDGSCRLHTWALGLSGYMAATREWAETVIKEPHRYDAYWHRDDVALVHFLGHDCAYSHMVVYPSLLSMLPGATPAVMFYPNQFLKLDGKNLSTSRNHAIWARDLIAEYSADPVRLYLASIAPEESEGDFRVSAFKQWHREIFVDQIDALIERGRSEGHNAAQVLAVDELLLDGMAERWKSAASKQAFSMRALAQIVFDLIALGRERLDEGRPVSHIVQAIGTFGQAIHPALSGRISAALSFNANASSLQEPQSNLVH